MKYHSHVGQDRWVAEVYKFKLNGFFLEFGAFDGVEGSNTFWIEKQLGWRGICVEPNPTYFSSICTHRTCVAVNRALWSESNLTLKLHDAHGLSRLTHIADEISTADLRSLMTSRQVSVDTINPVELLERFDAPELIEYLSMDIEGSELCVLKSMNFSKYKFGLLSIEVNNDEGIIGEVRRIMREHGYEHCALRNDDLFYNVSNIEILSNGVFEHPAHVCDRVLNSYIVCDIRDREPLTRPNILPSPWIYQFSNANDWRQYSEQIIECKGIIEAIDDKLIYSRKPFKVEAYCSYCKEAQSMDIDWTFSGSAAGEIWPAWTETSVCCGCGLNSRMRAVYDFVVNKLNLSQDAVVYMPEQITLGYSRWYSRFKNAVGSECIDNTLSPGTLVSLPGQNEQIRHEDMTRLSFSGKSVDLVVSQDVFEHIPSYKKAFRECLRVLRPNGNLVFSIPFFAHLDKTEIRAKLDHKGKIDHLMPPEYHGNPISGEGSLCFQHFGWDILDDLREQGFSDATANLYWAPWLGHFGSHFFVFAARR